MLMVVKTGDSLLINFIKFFHMFWDLSCMSLSQLSSVTETFVTDGFQECSHMSDALLLLEHSIVNKKWDLGLALCTRKSTAVSRMALCPSSNKKAMKIQTDTFSTKLN
jgi:hypothetical protein